MQSLKRWILFIADINVTLVEDSPHDVMGCARALPGTPVLVIAHVVIRPDIHSGTPLATAMR